MDNSTISFLLNFSNKLYCQKIHTHCQVFNNFRFSFFSIKSTKLCPISNFLIWYGIGWLHCALVTIFVE